MTEGDNVEYIAIQSDELDSWMKEGEVNMDEDMVNSPKHYRQGSMEAIDLIKNSMNAKEYRGYLTGSAMKYLMRHPYKGNPIQDIEKAVWYLNKLKELWEERRVS